ncbi:type II secretion system F family protein [Methanobrevibacter sp. AbM4]|uniref:type II secretion system F family protein n=1 Tax=Methanobrevibacter sp. AbM4 TaxID=224719 RepID=UPI0003348882|nr:type II secretion system F family protein [Methanobrevibacter sp. AbM4]AGN16187.1 type II secretion system protein F GspF1 [Methanobrevibacter sp. AbM4]
MLDDFWILIADLFLIIIESLYGFILRFKSVVTGIRFKDMDKDGVKEENNGVEKRHGETIFKNLRDYLNLSFKNRYSYDELDGDEIRDDLLFNTLTNRISVKKIRLDSSFVKPLLFLSILLFLIISYFFSFETGLVSILIVYTVIYFINHFEDIQKKNKYLQISKELPFVLRHMATELRSGKGLNDTLISIVNSDYTILSGEFNRLIQEVKYGKSFDNALIDMGDRINSKGFRRVVFQIISANKVGANLSNSLSIIAEDISFDMRIKFKDYAQKLNGFIMIYSFLLILAPVVLLIMLIGASTVLGDVFPSNVLYLIYCLLFPMVILFMAFLVKKLEPKI